MIRQRRLRVVVVNYNGGDLTTKCVASLLDAEPVPDVVPEIVLIDNASSDGVADRIEAEMTGVRVSRSPQNIGFAGGCNLGMGDLDSVDFVALVNSDATVDGGWLAPLVTELDADHSVGAASPKILFGAAYRRLELESAEPSLRISGCRGNGDLAEQLQYVDGVGSWAPAGLGEPWFRNLHQRATLHVPVARGTPPDSVELRLGADVATTVVVRSADRSERIVVGPGDAWHRVPLDGQPFDVVNNVGTVLLADGYGVDRGFQEPDGGQFDEPEDIQLWSGGAVLLRAEYLRDAGPFDERLFLYYEDVDLALRGAARGWRHRYVPGSVVRHVHSASAVAGSELAEHYKERNRLLLVLRHRGAITAVVEVARYLLVTLSYARRDIVIRLLRGKRPAPVIVRRRLRALIAFGRSAPQVVRSL